MLRLLTTGPKLPEEPKTVSEAACPVIPRKLLQRTPIPIICKNSVVTDDNVGCIEALIGPEGEPEKGALGSCNSDKATAREILGDSK